MKDLQRFEVSGQAVYVIFFFLILEEYDYGILSRFGHPHLYEFQLLNIC